MTKKDKHDILEPSLGDSGVSNGDIEPAPEFIVMVQVLNLCGAIHEDYAGGARVKNLHVKTYGMIKFLFIETVEIKWAFEKT